MEHNLKYKIAVFAALVLIGISIMAQATYSPGAATTATTYTSINIDTGWTIPKGDWMITLSSTADPSFIQVYDGTSWITTAYIPAMPLDAASLASFANSDGTNVRLLNAGETNEKITLVGVTG